MIVESSELRIRAVIVGQSLIQAFKHVWALSFDRCESMKHVIRSSVQR